MDTIHIHLQSLANEALDSVLSVLPSDTTGRLAILIEATRVLDYYTVFNQDIPETHRLAQHDLDLIRNGWGKLASHCFAPVVEINAFPMRESTKDSRNAIFGMLYRCAQSVTLRRTADMVKNGFMMATWHENVIELNRAAHTHSQFVDAIDFDQLQSFDRFHWGSKDVEHNGWTMMEHSTEEDLPTYPGAFMSRGIDRLASWQHEDVNSLMLPLIKPWDSGHGVMMAYNALPEVDDHFFSLAMEFVLDCRSESGFHPSARIPFVNSTDLYQVLTVIVGLHMKHVRFAMLAIKSHPNILTPQSLTIWGPESELAESIADYTGLSLVRVKAAMRALTLRASEASFLENHTLANVPLLLGLDNGIVVRPVSSIARNPLSTTLNLLRYRYPSAQDAIMKPRESWLRKDLYGLFSGSRYIHVDGNVNLRDGSGILTDVDAAIFDRCSGDLALFQLKWQDYFTNDIRELRSRAKNLAEGLDKWAERVLMWLNGRPFEQILSAFRLGHQHILGIRSITLFGISYSIAHVSGYGYEISCDKIAVTNWAKLFRLRHKIGPVDSVFPKLHDAICAERTRIAQCTPIPVEWKIGDTTIRFADNWNAIPDQDEISFLEKLDSGDRD